MTELPELNLLGRNASKQLGILVDNLTQQIIPRSSTVCRAVFEDLEPDGKLQNECRKSCEEFPVFKPELGKLFLRKPPLFKTIGSLRKHNVDSSENVI